MICCCWDGSYFTVDTFLVENDMNFHFFSDWTMNLANYVSSQQCRAHPNKLIEVFRAQKDQKLVDICGSDV